MGAKALRLAKAFATFICFNHTFSVYNKPAARLERSSFLLVAEPVVAVEPVETKPAIKKAGALRQAQGKLRRNCLPKKLFSFFYIFEYCLSSFIYQRSGLLSFFYSNLILNLFTDMKNNTSIIPMSTNTCFQTTSKPVPLIMMFLTIS